VGGVAEDAAVDGDEHAVGHEAAAPLARDAERVEVGVRDEAKHLPGPLGDGPVEVTGHGSAA
jgi:hypothetical protein